MSNFVENFVRKGHWCRLEQNVLSIDRTPIMDTSTIGGIIDVVLGVRPGTPDQIAMAWTRADGMVMLTVGTKTIEITVGAGRFSAMFGGPGELLHVQRDTTGVLFRYEWDGTLVPGTVPMPYDSFGIFEINDDGTPVSMFQAPSGTFSGRELSRYIQRDNFIVGGSDHGLLGGAALGVRNATTGEYTYQFCHIWSPYPFRLDVVNGVARVGVSGESAPGPDELPWTTRIFPPADIPGERRSLTVVDETGVHAPGVIPWSDDGSHRPFLEGGHWAVEAYLAGQPAAVIFHDLRESIDAQIDKAPDGWTVRKLATLSKARLVLYRDQNSAVAVGKNPDGTPDGNAIQYGEAGQERPEEIAIERWPDVMLVKELRAGKTLDDGTIRPPIDALIGHQGYLVVNNRPTPPGPIRWGFQFATYCIEIRGLQIYQRAGIPVMILFALFEGNNLTDGQVAWPALELARVLHGTAPLIQNYGCVEMIGAIGATRYPAGHVIAPELLDIWQRFCQSFPAHPALPIPAGPTVSSPSPSPSPSESASPSASPSPGPQHPSHPPKNLGWFILGAVVIVAIILAAIL